MKSVSLPKVLIFIIVVIGSGFAYYKHLKKSDGDKKLKFLKHFFMILITIGLLSIFSTMKEDNEKFIILIIILLLTTIYNIDHSIHKCNFETLYKVNLFGRSAIVLLFISLLLYYSYEGEFFRFLYSERELDSGDSKYTVDELEDKLKLDTSIPDYCPDMDNDDYKDDPVSDAYKKWDKLSSKKKNNCLVAKSSIYERKDISDKIYA